MRSFTSPICGGRPWWAALLLALGLLPLLPLLTLAQHRPASAGASPLAAGQPLRQALTSAGTLRPGARGSFDATGYRMGTDPATGAPVFQPNRVAGAGDENWSGTTIGALNAVVYALAVAPTGDVIVGGNFLNAGGVAAADYIARWDGTAWHALGGGLPDGVLAIAVAPNGDVVAGGRFLNAGGVAAADYIARWNGTAWQSLGPIALSNQNALVFALVYDANGDLLVGGSFLNAGGNPAADNVARWDGTAWQSLNTGLNSGVTALALAANGDVVAGGGFVNAGGEANANRVARYDGTAWHAVGPGPGILSGSHVLAVAVAPNGDVLVGGVFENFAGNPDNDFITRWDGTTWQPLGTGMNQQVIALAVLPNGDVVAGGLFMDAGGNPNADRVARWDGTAWQALGTSTNGSVRALGVANGKIYAGGTFTATGDVSKPLSRFGSYTFDVAPTAIGLSPQSVAENTAGGTAIGNFSTTDADAGDTFTYTLVSGTGSTHNGAFSINGNQLRITASPDFETQSSYAIRVRSTDAGGLFTEQTFTITVTDVAEDLVVSTAQTIPAGLYRNVTITSTGDAMLGGNITVTGTLLVRNTFRDACFTVSGPGAFTLGARAVLYICSPQGISASGATGSIQVMGARTFSPHAVYVYEGTVAQVTGSGLPGQVYILNQFNPVSLTLSQPLALRSALSMARPGNLVLNGNSFTLLSNADTTAFVANFNTGVVVGAATVQRYLTPGTAPTLAYRHLSAPVTNTTVTDLAAPGFTPVVNPAYNTSPTPLAVRPYPNVFGFNEARLPASTDFASGYFSLTALAAPLVSGRGYSVALVPTTLDFVGTLGTGSVPLSLTRTGATSKSGWHELGNPYPQPLDWDNVTVPAGLSPTIWIWKSTGGTSGAYRTRQSSGGGVGTGTLLNGILPMGQGFFAQVTGAGPVSFSFENAHRAAPFADGPLYRAAPAPTVTVPTLRLTLAAAGADADHADATFVQLAPGATLEATDRLDAVAPARNVGVPTLRTLGPQGEELGISALPEAVLTSGATVDLLLDLPAAGAYALGVGELTALDGAVLLDRTTGTRYDLTHQPSVAFRAAEAGELRGRFALIFGQRALGTAAERTTPAFTLAPNPARGTVRLSGAPTGSITLLDATGRTVRTWAARENGADLSLTGLTPGVYIVRAGLTTQRLVVE